MAVSGGPGFFCGIVSLFFGQDCRASLVSTARVCLFR